MSIFGGVVQVVSGLLLAEAVGFEPTKGCPSLVFKTSAFNHSATLPTSDKFRILQK